MKKLVKLTLLLLCGVVVLGTGDRSYGEGDFYVVGVGSTWKRNGTNVYYNNGNVGIGTDNPDCLLTIVSGGGDAVKVYNSNSNSSNWSTGVFGECNNGFGIYGKGGIGVHAYGTSNYHPAVEACLGNDQTTSYGSPDDVPAVDGANFGSTGGGVKGYGATYGVKGSTANGYGVHGKSLTGDGVRGESNGDNKSGVYGVNLNSNGYGVFCRGNFAAVEGTKNAIVPTSQGNRKLYSQESPEVWFEDMGEGQLEGGKAHIDLDPLFLETVTINDQHPMKVFIQLNDDCNGVYVQRGNNGFEVKELRHGTSSAHFTYRIMAKRKGYETARLEAAPDPVKVADLKTPPVAKAPPALAAFQH
jgi:hypothetical protein